MTFLRLRSFYSHMIIAANSQNRYVLCRWMILLQLQLLLLSLLHDHGTAPLQPGSPHDNFPLSAVSPVCSAAVSHCCRENGQIVACERGKVWSKSQPHNLYRSNGDLAAGSVCGQVAAWFI